MSHLINSYSLTAEPSVNSSYVTFNSYDTEQEGNAISITLMSSHIETPSINAKHIETLKQIENLPDNWDEDNSIAPPPNVIQFTKGIILLMSAIGQEIYNIAPGPNREILILFSNDKRSFEVLIYPNELRYVKFPEYGSPIQDTFTPELLYTHLLSWFNS
jgi:hypothetical protein